MSEAKKKGAFLDEDDRDRLGTLVRKRGRQEVARLLGVSDDTLARAAAGFLVNTSTAELIRMKLEALDEAEA